MILSDRECICKCCKMGCLAGWSRVSRSLAVRLDVNALASHFPEDLKGNAFICEVPIWVSDADLGIPIVLSTCCGGFTILMALCRLGGGDLEMWLVSV